MLRNLGYRDTGLMGVGLRYPTLGRKTWDHIRPRCYSEAYGGWCGGLGLDAPDSRVWSPAFEVYKDPESRAGDWRSSLSRGTIWFP